MITESKRDQLIMAAGQKSKERDHWLNKLSGDWVNTQFPADFPMTTKKPQELEALSFPIAQETFEDLMRLSNGSDVRLYLVLAAGLFALLNRYTRNTDLIIGTPILKQETAAEYVNTVLPLRQTFDEGISFKNLLLQVRQTFTEAVEHQSYPMEVLREQLQRTESALFDVALVLENMQDETYLHAVRPNIQFQFLRTDSELEGVLIFNAGQYRRDSAERFAQHFASVLGQVAGNVEMSLADVDVLTKAEKEQILSSFNRNQASLAYPQDKTLTELFETQALKTPDQTAVECEGNRLTYQDLNAKANRLARVLRAKGVKRDEVVALMVDRSPEMIVSILAILKAGGAYLAIDPTYPEQRIRFLLSDCEARLLLTEAQFANCFPLACEVLDIKEAAAYETEESNLPTMATADSLAYVLYTSGSTGQPKGVMVEHRNVNNLVHGLWERIFNRYSGPMRVALLSPYVFDPSVQTMFSALLQGHTLYMVPDDVKRDGRQLLRFYEQHGIAISDGTPSHLRLILESRAEELLVASELKHLMIGGEVLPQQVAAKFLQLFDTGAPIISNLYGPSECCVDSTMFDVTLENVNEYESLPIGSPLPNVQVYVLGQDNDVLPIGVPGELCISGEGVSRGYLKRPELQAEKFTANPFAEGQLLYRTGDIARWLPDGSLEFLGRIDQQVKISGHRIELEEIESALRRFKRQDATELELPMSNEHLLVKTCAHCLLPVNYPGVRFDEEGVCSVCREFEQYQTHAQNYFRDTESFHDLMQVAKEHKSSEYDCLLLYSGGKDSSYVLYKLVEMGYRVLTWTFDNGHISQAAFQNIKRVTDSLGVPNITDKLDRMNDVFVESLKTDCTVCTGCFKTLTNLSTRLAEEMGINVVITGLSRGQIFDTKLHGLLQQGIYELDEIEKNLILFRKMYLSTGDNFAKYLDNNFTESTFEEIKFVDFFRYDRTPVHEVKRYLELMDEYWSLPQDTGFCSSNCMINDVGTYVHLKNKGYHNYAAPLSWDFRLGISKREDGLAELNFQTNEARMNKVLRDIGYFDEQAPTGLLDVVVTDRMDEDGTRYLAAYCVTEEELDRTELRNFLAQRLPDYMIPTYFIRLDSLPLTLNGKLNKQALPDPKRQIGADRTFVAPRNELEAGMVRIWAEVLGLDVSQIGVHDKFFDLGGNSFKVVQLSNKLQDFMEREVPIVHLFRYTTIASLTEFLVSVGDAAAEVMTNVDDTAAEAMQSLEDTMTLLGGFDHD